MKFACVSVVFATFIVANVWAQDGSAESKMLEGAWSITAAEVGEKALPEAFTKTMKMVLAGDKYTVTVGDMVDKGTVKIDPAKKPKTMDIVGTEGPSKGKTILAIYEIKGDTLRVCYDLTGTVRPTEFKTKKDEPLFLATYQRTKK